MPIILQVIIIVLLVTGIVSVFASFIYINGGDKKSGNDYFTLSNSIRAIDKSIGEADKVIDDMERISREIFDEFEKKYQELLFLYNMLENKRHEIAGKADVEIVDSRKHTHPQYNEIVKMQKSGMSTVEIAKKLEIGVTELQLILGFGKER